MDLSNEDDRKGLVGTILVHSLLILLFIISAFSPRPVDIEEDGGVEVSVGEPDYGGPDNSPATTEEESQPQPSSEQQEDPVLSQDEDAPEVKQSTKKPSPKPPTKETPKTEETKTEERKANQRAQFKTTSDSKGQGDGTKQGNQGQPDGSEKGTPDGTGKGTDGSRDYDLAGRSPLNRFKPSTTESIDGKVVVQITVDRGGNVIRAVAGYRGTTITNAHFKQISEETAMKWKFSPRKDGNGVQTGTITFVYSRN